SEVNRNVLFGLKRYILYVRLACLPGPSGIVFLTWALGFPFLSAPPRTLRLCVIFPLPPTPLFPIPPLLPSPSVRRPIPQRNIKIRKRLLRAHRRKVRHIQPRRL